MIKHIIYTRHDRHYSGEKLSVSLIKKSVRAALAAENIDIPCEVGVMIMDDVSIRALNLAYRGVDASTDVLSFPTAEQVPGQFEAKDRDFTAGSGIYPLGDIAVSAEHVISQAERYGTGILRETAYLVVHSVLHLLGYDHLDEGEQKELMRSREDKICRMIEI
jgi:probable rRNA maturation factor